MTNQQVAYLTLLRAAIWDQDAQITHIEDVPGISRLAMLQGTGPLVFDQLLKLNGVDIPTALRLQMKQQCASSMIQQGTMLPILSDAWNALVDADIHPVLLKGFALARYYPQPHLRQWGDIDLYVGQKQYHAACKVLNEVFPDADHPAEDDEERKHYNFVFRNALLEIHRISMAFHHPRDRRYYERLEEAWLTKDGPSFKYDGIIITTPEETFELFFTFLHAWHHFIETGMNMKQLCDVAILLHEKCDSIDRDRLCEMLTKLHLLEVWQLIMYIMVRHFELQQEECPFYTEQSRERAELLFEHILSEGASFKRNEIQTGGISYLKRKYLTFRSRLDDSRRVRPFAPNYARHMVIGDFLHGIERTISGK